MTALANSYTYTYTHIDPRASCWAALFSRRNFFQGIQGSSEQQKEKNGQVSQVPAGRMGPSVEGSRVSCVISSLGRELDAVRKHVEAMVASAAVVLIWTGFVVVRCSHDSWRHSCGHHLGGGGSWVWVVVGAVTNRRYVWYQVEMEEEGNTTGIVGIPQFLCGLAASSGPQFVPLNVHENWFS